MWYILIGVCSFILSVIFTLVCRRLASRFSIVDDPRGITRKIHTRPIPLLGGLAIIAAFCAVLLFLLLVYPHTVVAGLVKAKFIIGILIAAIVIGIGGALDDRYHLKPKQLIWISIIASAIAIAAGIGITHVRNPLDPSTVIDLSAWTYTLFYFHAVPYAISLPADLFTFAWLMGMMFATKFLDGLDGLVSGIGAIGAGIVTLVSLSSAVAQPETATIAMIVAGACLGFLLFNFNPASLFLGESGSVFIGFILGVLAILAGSKVATVLLIIGIPALDVAWVITQRLIHRASPFAADKSHLHFRLLAIGLSQRQAVLVLYFVTILFGGAALLFETRGKFIALCLLVIIMAIAIGMLMRKMKRTQERLP